MATEVVIKDNVFIASSSTLEISNSFNITRLIITAGNVFQPYSKLTIAICDDSKCNIDEGTKDISLSIGGNNLFEEYSNVVIYYDWLNIRDDMENENGESIEHID